MLKKLIFGSHSERMLRRLRPQVAEINLLAEKFSSLSDEELRRKTDEFRRKVAEREKELEKEIDFWQTQVEESSAPEAKEKLKVKLRGTHNRAFEEVLPEAFAVVKETCRRLLGKRWEVSGIEIAWDMVPFDVQILGAIILHQGKIAEMATGEGKTLVATMPIYLNALSGRGVHVVTVNDYLARRDAQWMGEVYKFLGLTVGCIQNEMEPGERRAQYACDITYGTNNEFGFDYLRDNMAISREAQVQRGHSYAIIDEVDSILVDEARTPLIISGAVEHSLHSYKILKNPVADLVKKQAALINKILSDAEELLKKGREEEAAFKLLQVGRGAPKNKKFMKLLQEPRIKRLRQDVEVRFHTGSQDRDAREKAHGLEAELFFSIDERGNTVNLSTKGEEHFSSLDPNLFVTRDKLIEEEQLERSDVLSPEERVAKIEALEKEFRERGPEIERENLEKEKKRDNIYQLIKAHSLFEKDVEYVVTDGKVVIVDEFTGRLMPGRRYSDGLHEALEAKEGVEIEKESQTLATITLQNYFRLYEKLAGMTGTAETEAVEFQEIYNLEVVVIPTNEPVRRIDYDDLIYKSRRQKYNAIIAEVEELSGRGQPVLVGTTSVEVSETLSRLLKRKGIPHSVLNAKYHQQEAEIVAKAGHWGAVTIATNMAGRGTDIKLGEKVVRHPNCGLREPRPDEEVCPFLKELNCQKNVPCGLRIIGTERHEARRIDRQLRGRSGRQGDPGSSRFYLSLEDDLMRLFGSERIAAVMERFKLEEETAIEVPLVTRAIGTAQKRVELYNFEIRKHLLDYDNVLNQQREIVYAERGVVLKGEDLREEVERMVEEAVTENLEIQGIAEGTKREEWRWPEFLRWLRGRIPVKTDDIDVGRLSFAELKAEIKKRVNEAYRMREERLTPALMRHLERMVMLSVVDSSWKDHLYNMDALREGINLRAYAQRDPLIEYKQEGFALFSQMNEKIRKGVAEIIFRAQAIEEERLSQIFVPRQFSSPRLDSLGVKGPSSPEAMRPAGKTGPPPSPPARPTTFRRPAEKIGRNDPCPCGKTDPSTGKPLKYKKCCGR